ncbi:MAG TPA: heme o synthase, partial [Chloroflexota bacterium]|nr:heme o synthase [Chloroflexota bacterium]
MTSALIFAVPAVAWLWHRQRRFLLPATLVPALLAIQIALGAVVVWLELPAFVVLVHLGFAMLILGAMVWLAAWVAPGPVALGAAPGAPGTGRDYYRALVSATAGLTLFLVLTGAFTRATGASWACAGFPGCAVPQEAVQAAEAGGARGLVQIHLFHRATAYLVAVLTLASIGETWRLRRAAPALRRAALLLAGCLAAQIAIGAAAATFGLPVVLRGAHVAGAAATWGAAVLLAALAWKSEVRGAKSQVPSRALGDGRAPRVPAADVGRGTKIRALLSLTKPRVILLLEVPTLAAMLIAGEGWPAPLLVGATLLGGALAAGGAAAINAYLDRDIDALMGSRTQRRPIPAGTVRPGEALAFGLALAVASFAVLLVFANLLAAVLAQVALLFYVFVYTRWLKRSTPSNIVIGGAAGAIPPLVGWAAVTGSLGPTAWLLFAIIFFWTPPHFWALSLLLQQHYARAGVPMLPVVRGEDETRRQIIYYTLQLIAVTVFVFTFGLSGLFYLGAALGLGGIFLYLAWRLWQEASAPAARRLFHYSMLYLWLLCAALVVDQRFF